MVCHNGLLRHQYLLYLAPPMKRNALALDQWLMLPLPLPASTDAHQRREVRWRRLGLDAARIRASEAAKVSAGPSDAVVDEKELLCLAVF
jgi:hypothetical protein